MIHGRAGINLYGDILDKVKNRINRWDSSKLSFAGRAVLVKSMVAAMPSYVMHTNLLPQETCNQLD